MPLLTGGMGGTICNCLEDFIVETVSIPISIPESEVLIAIYRMRADEELAMGALPSSPLQRVRRAEKAVLHEWAPASLPRGVLVRSSRGG